VRRWIIHFSQVKDIYSLKHKDARLISMHAGCVRIPRARVRHRKEPPTDVLDVALHTGLATVQAERCHPRRPHLPQHVDLLIASVHDDSPSAVSLAALCLEPSVVANLTGRLGVGVEQQVAAVLGCGDVEKVALVLIQPHALVLLGRVAGNVPEDLGAVHACDKLRAKLTANARRATRGRCTYHMRAKVVVSARVVHHIAIGIPLHVSNGPHLSLLHHGPARVRWHVIHKELGLLATAYVYRQRCARSPK